MSETIINHILICINSQKFGVSKVFKNVEIIINKIIIKVESLMYIKFIYLKYNFSVTNHVFTV